VILLSVSVVVHPSPTIPYTRIIVFRELLDHLRSYVKSVLEDPKNVEAVVQELLKDQNTLKLFYRASKEVLNFSQSDWLDALKSFYALGEKFKDAGIDAEDALDIIAEHDTWKLQQIRKNFNKYTIMLFDFSVNYPEGANRYIIVYMSVFLLLIATIETRSLEKLRALGEELNRFAEELELYTLTFMIGIDESWEKKLDIIATARTPEELRRVLEID